MLTSLHVKNLAVIEEEEIYFGKGLNILTGETGAGKSVLLGSVGLALGGRADKNMIRNNADHAIAELTFTLDPVKDKHIYSILETENLSCENDSLTFTRKITRDRSTARINGETVNSSIIHKLASELLDIHGQHDNTILLKAGNHMELLDLYGGKELENIKNDYKTSYNYYKKCEKELTGAVMDSVQREHNLALIYHEINEIDSSSLKPGEDEALEKEYFLMKNSRKVCEGVNNAHEMICGDEGILTLLGRSIRELNGVTQYDEGVDEVLKSLNVSEELLSDASRFLGRYTDELEFDPERFEEIEERIDLINKLKSKYGYTIEDILNYRDRQAEQAEMLNDYDSYVQKLKLEFTKAEKKASSLAQTLTLIRKKASQCMEKSVIENLKDLNFTKVEFEIHIDQLEELSVTGQDSVEFFISLNPGEKISPLAQIASGGELSRIMLAIKTAMSDKDSIQTLIFDEIDAGISGITANKVADKLQLISADRQVICITHLSQIAARSDHHFLIEKSVENDRTQTHIKELDEASSIRELARIIGGDSITDSTLETASELKREGMRKYSPAPD